MRNANPTTRAVVSAIHSDYSYPTIARRLGLERRFWPVLQRIVKDGPVSLEAENAVRIALGLAPLPALVEVPPCPDCASVHTGRCNGKQVAEVVTLAPGEHVKPARVVHPDVSRMVRGLKIALEKKDTR